MTTLLTFTGPLRQPATTPLGRMLDAYMDANHLSQMRMAEAIGVDHALVSRWRNGSRTPSYPSMCRIAGVLGIRVETVALAAHGFDPGAYEQSIREDERARIVASITKEQAA